MDADVMQLARQLLDSGLTRLSEREQRIITMIAKRSHVARNVDTVLAERQTFGERLVDRVAQLGGSWGFIAIFAGMLVAWVVLNTVILARSGGGFDPYPYIFLNLILSMVAALQAPMILMSLCRRLRPRLAALAQNRPPSRRLRRAAVRRQALTFRNWSGSDKIKV